MLKYIIALKLLVFNNAIINEIINVLDESSLEELFNGHFTELQIKYNFITEKYSSILSDETKLCGALKRAEIIIDKSNQQNIEIISILDRRYPEKLKVINNRPIILYVKGYSAFENYSKSISCVGTRSPSEFGINAVRGLVPNWVDEGFTIVSGLAEGIDSISHEACLLSGGKTIAILAHGLDSIYPKSNENLANEILQNSGMLVSEYPVGSPAEKHNFIDRNRLTVGLSEAVVVFEMKVKSGSMHSINFAIEQKKPIFCPIPSELDIDTLQGLKKLLYEKKVIGLKNPNEYFVLCKALGYKLAYEKERKIRLLMRKSINNLALKDIKMIVNSKVQTKLKNNTNLDVDVDKDVYEVFKSIVQENNLTIKEVIDSFICGFSKLK